MSVNNKSGRAMPDWGSPIHMFRQTAVVPESTEVMKSSEISKEGLNSKVSYKKDVNWPRDMSILRHVHCTDPF